MAVQCLGILSMAVLRLSTNIAGIWITTGERDGQIHECIAEDRQVLLSRTRLSGS